MMQKLRICAGFVEAGCGALAMLIAGTYETALEIKVKVGEVGAAN